MADFGIDSWLIRKGLHGLWHTGGALAALVLVLPPGGAQAQAPAGDVDLSAAVRIKDPEKRRVFLIALEAAARRLERPKCRKVLDTFKAVDTGRRLSDVLGDQTIRGYLATLQFHEGAQAGRCAEPGVVARSYATAPIVIVCDGWYLLDRRWQQATLLHEVLHALGLGENPPSPREITDRVLAACW